MNQFFYNIADRNCGRRKSFSFIIIVLALPGNYDLVENYD